MKKMKIVFFISIQLFFVTSVLAGDYLLTISSKEESSCIGRKIIINDTTCYSKKSRPYCRSDSVIKDLQNFFSGINPEIEILKSAFSNGHLLFCNQEAKKQISDALNEIKVTGNNPRDRYLKEFITVNEL